MKYIRTKDGIYKSKRNPIEKDCLVIGEKENGKLGLIVKDIIKKADTIEELCDAWIIVPIGVNCNPYVRHIKQNISHFINSNHVIFAAIWCQGNNHEPILKPVAKMNEKGELELL